MPKQQAKTRAPARPQPTQRPARTNAVTWLCALVPVAATVAVRANAFGYGFIWDDPLVLQQLRAIHGLGDLFVLPEAIPKFYYRPLIFLTFLADRALGGEAPFWFHTTVIVADAVATLLVFLIARRLLGVAFTIEAGLAALLFAVHPIHVESVVWIAGRSDVIATVFMLAALLASTWTDRSWTAWLAGGLALLAFLSKEVAAALLVLVPLRDRLMQRRLPWARYLPLALAGGVYLVLRYVGLGAVGTGLPSHVTATDQIRDLVAGLGWYACKLIAPVHLTAYVPAVPSAPGYVIAGVVTLIGTGATALWAARSGQGVPAFLLVWFIVTLAPSLGVIVRRSASAPVADRYLYLPSVAAAIMVAWLVSRLRPAPVWRWRAAVAGVACVATVAGALTVDRTRVWGDPLVFWSDVVANAPQVGMPYRERGNIYMGLGKLDEAERDFRAAAMFEKEPEGRVMNYNNYGNLYLRRNQLGAAEAAYKAGLQIYQHAFLYSGLGRVEIRKAEEAQENGKSDAAMQAVHAARDYLEQAVAVDPRDYKSHVLLGQVLFNLREYPAAREHFEIGLAIEPRGAVADTARRFLARMPREQSAVDSRQ